MKDRGYIILNELTGSYLICIPKGMKDPYKLLYSRESKTHYYAPVANSTTAIEGLQYIRNDNKEE